MLRTEKTLPEILRQHQPFYVSDKKLSYRKQIAR